MVYCSDYLIKYVAISNRATKRFVTPLEVVLFYSCCSIEPSGKALTTFHQVTFRRLLWI